MATRRSVGSKVVPDPCKPRTSRARHQAVDDLADRASLLATEGDPRVRMAGGVNAEEVLILGEDDPAQGKTESDMVLVRRLHQPGIRRRRHIDAVTTQPLGDGRVGILIKMEADRSRHSFA